MEHGETGNFMEDLKQVLIQLRVYSQSSSSKSITNNQYNFDMCDSRSFMEALKTNMLGLFCATLADPSSPPPPSHQMIGTQF